MKLKCDDKTDKKVRFDAEDKSSFVEDELFEIIKGALTGLARIIRYKASESQFSIDFNER